MKKISNYIIIATLLLLSCQNPLDISTERKKELIGNKEFNYYFMLDSFDLGFIHPKTTVEEQLYILNTTDKVLIISDISFIKKQYFTYNLPNLPLSLNPKNTSGSGDSIYISFKSNESGDFYDSLIVENNKNPYVQFYIKVADLYSKDINFYQLSYDKDEYATKKIIFYNNSNRFLKITHLDFSNTQIGLVEDVDSLSINPKDSIIKHVFIKRDKIGKLNGILKIRSNNASFLDSIVNISAEII